MELQRPIKRSCAILTDTTKKLELPAAASSAATTREETEPVSTLPPNLDEHLLKSQLEFILKISTDIRKNTESIIA